MEEGDGVAQRAKAASEITRARPPQPLHADLRFFDRSGRFVQNFASIELLVVAWLLKLERSTADAQQFLKENRWLDARVERLQALLRLGGHCYFLRRICQTTASGYKQIHRHDVSLRSCLDKVEFGKLL